MSDPTGDNDNIPPWILPYVHLDYSNVERLSSRVSVLLAGVVFQQIVQELPDARTREMFNRPLSVFLDKAIDDCGSTGKKPWPPKPHHVAFLEAAAQVGSLALTLQNRGLASALGDVSRELTERGNKALSK